MRGHESRSETKDEIRTMKVEEMTNVMTNDTSRKRAGRLHFAMQAVHGKFFPVVRLIFVYGSIRS
jgi:hypothetical protein